MMVEECVCVYLSGVKTRSTRSERIEERCVRLAFAWCCICVPHCAYDCSCASFQLPGCSRHALRHQRQPPFVFHFSTLNHSIV